MKTATTILSILCIGATLLDMAPIRTGKSCSRNRDYPTIRNHVLIDKYQRPDTLRLIKRVETTTETADSTAN